MNILETYYTYAKLAQAAYIDLSNVVNPLNRVNIVNAAASDDQKRVPRSLAENIFGVDEAVVLGKAETKQVSSANKSKKANKAE